MEKMLVKSCFEKGNWKKKRKKESQADRQTGMQAVGEIYNESKKRKKDGLRREEATVFDR